jgi:hypothetical protein
MHDDTLACITGDALFAFQIFLRLTPRGMQSLPIKLSKIDTNHGAQQKAQEEHS